MFGKVFFWEMCIYEVLMVYMILSQNKIVSSKMKKRIVGKVQLPVRNFISLKVFIPFCFRISRYESNCLGIKDWLFPGWLENFIFPHNWGLFFGVIDRQLLKGGGVQIRVCYFCVRIEGGIPLDTMKYLN